MLFSQACAASNRARACSVMPDTVLSALMHSNLLQGQLPCRFTRQHRALELANTAWTENTLKPDSGVTSAQVCHCVAPITCCSHHHHVQLAAVLQSCLLPTESKLHSKWMPHAAAAGFTSWPQAVLPWPRHGQPMQLICNWRATCPLNQLCQDTCCCSLTPA